MSLTKFSTCRGASCGKNSSTISPPFSSVMSAVGDLAAGGGAGLGAGVWASTGATTSAPRARSTSRSRVMRKPPGRDVATLYIAGPQPIGSRGSADGRTGAHPGHQQEDDEDHDGTDH